MKSKKNIKIIYRTIAIMFLIILYTKQSFGKILSLQLYIQYKEIHNKLTIITGILQIVIIVGFVVWAIIYYKNNKKDKINKRNIIVMLLVIIIFITILIEVFYGNALDIMNQEFNTRKRYIT